MNENLKYLSSYLFLVLIILALNSCLNVPVAKNGEKHEATTWTDMAMLINEESLFIKEGKNSKTSHPSENSVISEISIDENQKSKIIGYSTIPANNCVGNNVIRLNETLTKTTTFEYSIGANSSVESNTLPLINAGIELQFGLTKGMTLEKSFSFEVDVQPKTNTLYKIIWKEIWQKGNVKIVNESGEKKWIPFEIKSGIQYEISSVEELKCK